MSEAVKDHKAGPKPEPAAKPAPTSPKPAPEPDPKPASEPDPKPEGKPQTTPDSDDEEEFGSKGLADDILRDVRDVATLARALDNATNAFGPQTNQQINVYGGLTALDRIPQETLSQETLAGLRDSFVPPGGYRGAWDRMVDHDLVLLGGRPGYGRECTATYLLDAFCEARVARFTGGRLADLRAEDLTPGYGYVWRGLTVSGIGEGQLERLRDLVRERECRMILVWPHDAVWDHATAGHHHRLIGSAPPAQILDRHLMTDLAAEARARAEELLTDERVTVALDEVTTAHGAAALGKALREVVLGHGDLEEALERAAATSRSAADWFTDLENRTDRIFALALATLNGLPYPVVVSSARILDELVQRDEDGEGLTCIRPFDRPAPQLLRSVDAVRRSAEWETAYGVVPTEQVVSRRDDYSRRMLAVLWEDYPYLQEIYLEWLDELVKGADPYVRERAAFAAGMFAGKDFGFICDRLLFGWAASRRWTERRAVGTALRAPVLGTRLRQVVWDLLEHWSAPGDTADERQRRITAAAALGDPVGATDVPRALDVIGRRLLEHRPEDYGERLWNAIAYAVAELFGDGGAETGGTVLEQVAEWAARPDEGPRHAAVLTLIALVSKPSAERGVPPVLRAVGEDDRNLELVTGLWRLALNHPTMAEPAVRAVRTLAEHIPDGDAGGHELAQLVGSIPRTRRELNTLRYEVRHWNEPDGPSPAVASRITARLNECEVSL